MFFPKLITLAAVLAATLGVLLLQHRSVARQQESNARVQQSITSIENELGALESTRLTTPPTASSKPPLVPVPSSASSRSVAALSGASSAPTPVPFVTLSKANLKQLELAPLTEDFRLTDEVCAVLGVSESERTVVNQAVAKLLTTQQQMDVSRLQPIGEHLTSEEGRKTSYKVPAYPQEGRKLADELITQVQAAIGPERTELLVGYADLNSLSAVGYEPFGRTEKTITFLDRENPDGTRGDCKILMKVVDTATGLSLSTSFANRDDSIPQPWRHLIQNAAPEP